MIQTTISRKRSSGSSARHKRSQRLIINPPKPPKLTIRPPKPPQPQPNNLKIATKLSRSPSLDVSNSTYDDWAEISLLGQGPDASYDYGDICKVQAVIKAFNGLSSATRKVEAADQKASQSESADLIMSDPDSPSHLDDRAQAELEMNNILQEALNCHHCEKTMCLKPEAMESDMRHGIYRYGEDPPFLLNRPYDDVAPEKILEETWQPGYLRLATLAQHEQYSELVEQQIIHNRAKKVFAGMEKEICQGYESRFAVYCVDYHINQHYIHRRSILNYCQTDEEMDDIRDWKHRLALWAARYSTQVVVDSKEIWSDSEGENEPVSTTTNTIQPVQIKTKEVSETSNGFPITSNSPADWSSLLPSPASSVFSSTDSPSYPPTAASSPPKASPFFNPEPPLVDPWPKQQLSLCNQIYLHRQLVNPRERTARVRAARRRFRDLMNKRAIQRRDGLIIVDYEAAFARQKWFRGRGGPLILKREGKIGELLDRYNR